jgi:hypothetical protein
MGIIGTRTTWLITSQAFLVTGYVAAIAQSLNNDHAGEVWLAMPPNYRRTAEGGGINQTATPGPF